MQLLADLLWVRVWPHTQQSLDRSSQSQWAVGFLSNEQTKLGGGKMMVDLEGVRVRSAE